MILIKDSVAIEKMSQAGSTLAQIAVRVKQRVRAGVTTKELDREAQAACSDLGVVSAFKGYRGFPAHICVSVNEEIVHGIPGDRLLEDGDIVSVDLGILESGYYADMALTVPIGAIDSGVKKLTEVTREALKRGIRQAKPNNRIFDISYAVQSYVEQHGFSVVRDFVGHGIGTALHEEPQIPNFGQPHTGALIQEGMVFAIEPMVNMGTWEVELLDNGWTAVTKDRKPSCHFEHTVVVEKNGARIITQ